jgi:hypothetical protein
LGKNFRSEAPKNFCPGKLLFFKKEGFREAISLSLDWIAKVEDILAKVERAKSTLAASKAQVQRKLF